MSRHGYHAPTVTGPRGDKCSSCELLNILHKPKVGQKRCRECVEKENKRKMKMKHVPVHLRARTLNERTEKASRILAEEMESQGQPDMAEQGTEGYVNASRAPGLVSASGRNPEDEEEVKLSDILELTFELLELVEAHVGRAGSLEDVARFQSQMKVLRKGRDAAKSNGHVEDKRAIVLAFSIFTEHYTLTLREFEKLVAKNSALKQLAYDTAGLVKKSEAQFESYVNELKSLQGANFQVAHSTKVELTKLRNEVTALKLELNLRTNELREAQLDANSAQEQLRRERERTEEMRKDKDNRITSLLAQLQQFSLDYSHEKGERMRLERENERLWNDRMATRAEQIRGNQLSGAERALALERDALEKREWLEWKKKAALREIQGKERLRQEAWEVRQGIEADAYAQMEAIRKELGHAEGLETSRSTVGGRTKDQREYERERARADKDRAQRDREYWMELEQQPRPSAGFPPNLSPISSPAASTANAQRWGARKSQLDSDAEIDRMIEELRQQKEQLSTRQMQPPQQQQQQQQAYREMPATDPIRSGSYAGGVESVINIPRTAPALPLFNAPSNPSSAPVGYQPSSIASSIPPPVSAYPSQPTATSQQDAGQISEADREAIRREVEQEVRNEIMELQRKQQHQQQQQQQQPAPQQAPSRSSVAPAAAHKSSRDEKVHHRRVRSSASRSDSAASSSVDVDAVEEGLRRSRKVRGESNRVYNSTYGLDSKPKTTASSVRRGQVTVEDEDQSSSSDEEQARELHQASRRSSSQAERKYGGGSRHRNASTRDEDDSRSDSRERPSKPRRNQQSSAAAASSSAARHRDLPSEDSDEEQTAAATTAAYTVDGKAAVPVRNFTLYSVPTDSSKQSGGADAAER